MFLVSLPLKELNRSVPISWEVVLGNACYFFVCYQHENVVCAQEGPWLVRWQSDSPMVTTNVFFFFMGQRRGEVFSLFIVCEYKKNAMLRVREMNREMNICSPKAFWKSWTNGQNKKFYLVPG